MDFSTIDAWQLIAVGAAFAVLSAVNGLLKTIFRRAGAGYLDLALTFGAVLIPFAAVLFTHMGDAPDGAIAPYALVIAGGTIAASIVIALLELTLPARWKGSRGLMGVFSGVLLAAAALLIPFGWAYVTLNESDAESDAQAVADAALTPTAPADPVTGTPTATPNAEQRFADLFRSILGYASDATGLDELIIIEQLEGGTPFAAIVTDNGGDLEVVIDQIADVMRRVLREATDAGEVNPLQAALALSQMETFIRFMVNSDITQLGDRMGGATPEPGATRASLRALYETPQVTPGTTAPNATDPAAAVSPTPTPRTATTVPPSATPQPTFTLTPSPRAIVRTPEPSATRFIYQTRTPTPTFTPVTPCLASVEYNLRLRTAPNIDSETLLVIPFGTTVELIGRGGASSVDNPDARWWQAVYEGQTGWLDGQYMIVSRACATLPEVVS